MNFIGKFFIITFGAFASVFLGIYLFRLMNGNITFIGLSDVYYYFNNNSIDTFNTLEALTNEINNSISNFDLKIQAFNDIASPFNSQLPFLVQLAIMLGQFFTKFFDFFIAFGRIVMLPITTLYYTLQFIVGVLVYIFKFLQYVATYQGSTLPNFTSFVCQVKQGVWKSVRLFATLFKPYTVNSITYKLTVIYWQWYFINSWGIYIWVVIVRDVVIFL